MSELSILQTLVGAGMTVEAACAMGGNMTAESQMRANNLQDSKEKPLNFTDDTYTAAIDSGRYSREQFSFDDGGYGLCQWTHYERKPKLYDFAKKNGKSIGDEGMQVAFCLAELKTDYPILWLYLSNTPYMYDASERICKEYERPAVNNIAARNKYAKELWDKYSAVLSAGASHEEDIDREPSSYILPNITEGRTPEAEYLAALLKNIGYDVLWSGLWACIIDFQQKTGLTADGICGEKTWAKIMEASNG